MDTSLLRTLGVPITATRPHPALTAANTQDVCISPSAITKRKPGLPSCSFSTHSPTAGPREYMVYLYVSHVAILSHISGNRKFRQKSCGHQYHLQQRLVGHPPTQEVLRLGSGICIVNKFPPKAIDSAGESCVFGCSRYIYSSLFIADVHYGCFHISAIVNNAAMNFFQ